MEGRRLMEVPSVMLQRGLASLLRPHMAMEAWRQMESWRRTQTKNEGFFSASSAAIWHGMD
jgi:hypothetical protein